MRDECSSENFPSSYFLPPINQVMSFFALFLSRVRRTFAPKNTSIDMYTFARMLDEVKFIDTGFAGHNSTPT